MTNLVYFSVFYNKDYFKLAELLLKSMKLFSPPTRFDLLLLTAPEFSKEAGELARILPIQIHYLPFTTIFQAACARLHIFDYPHISAYQKILYLDTDILIKKDLNSLFDEPLADLLYGLESGTIASPSFGCQFFDFNTIDRNTTGINSGTLLFNNCDVIRNLFIRVRDHIGGYTGAIPYCMDQPFINYHAIRDNLYDNSMLKSHVSLFENSSDSDNADKTSICHFSYPIGNFQHKYYRMAEYFKKILSASRPQGTYSWGSGGRIRFECGLLETTWGTGTYELLGGNRVRATWKNHVHILQFDSTCDRYTSIRISPLDFDCMSGERVH